MTDDGRFRGAFARGVPLGLAAWLVWAALLVGVAAAQPRTEVVVGVAGAPVAGAWNPLRAVVRDAPGARLRVELDVGGLARGEVLQSGEWTFPDASGVQRLEVDLPLAEWRRLNWRVEHAGRLLASGGIEARERDDRPLALIVAASPSAWFDAFPEEVRPVPAASAELPTRAASWDGVALLLFDGTAAAPDAATVLTAAAAGVRVLLPPPESAGYAALAPLLASGGAPAGAGGIERLSDPGPGGRFELGGDGATSDVPTLAPARRRELIAAATAALPATEWLHLPRPLVAAVTAGYAALAWSLFRVGGPSGVLSGLLVLAAAVFALPLAAPADPAPVRSGAVVVAAGGLGVRSELREVARLPSGTAVLPGIFRPLASMPVAWSEGTTRLPLDPGGRARLNGPPDVALVPDRIREARATSPDEVPERLARSLPAGTTVVSDGNTWWLLRGDPRAERRRVP